MKNNNNDLWFTVKAKKSNKQYNVKKLFSPGRDRVYFGNGKTHFPAIGNTLAGNTTYDGSISENVVNGFKDHGIELVGTCPCNCDGCYAKKGTRYVSVAIAYILNTLELKADPMRYWSMVGNDIEKHLKKIFKKGGIVRVNDSGDLYSLENVIAFEKNIIERFPFIIFYGYTENHAFADYLNKHENVVFWKSRFTTSGSGNGYTYVDERKDNRIMDMIHCPSIDKNGKRTGKKCNECLICTKKELLKKLSLAFMKH